MNRLPALLLAAILALPAAAAESKKSGPSLERQLQQAGQRVQEFAKGASTETSKKGPSLEKQFQSVGDRLGQAWASLRETMRKWKAKLFGK